MMVIDLEYRAKTLDTGQWDIEQFLTKKVKLKEKLDYLNIIMD